MIKSRSKIVYILGSGFSKAFGYPIQSEVMPRVFSNIKYDREKELEKFLKHELKKPEKTPLEDIYTLFDKAISEGRQIGSHGPNSLRLLRNRLDRSIAKLFLKPINSEEDDLLNKFTNELAHLRISSGQTNDPVSILTTNWDFLLEQSLVNLTSKDKIKLYKPNYLNKLKKLVVDYCVYDNQLDETFIEKYPPSLQLKAKDFYNFKLLKLHGSVSWVKCPSCDALFIAFRWEKMKGIYRKSDVCRFCLKNLNRETKLRIFQISPTFVKDLSNVHYRMIWWNAAFEIAEATHLVFIGYSLPLADFDLRNIISKNIASDKELNVKIVLNANPDDEKSIYNFEIEKQRYKEFFGARISDKDFSSNGAADYIKRLIKRGNKSFYKFHEDSWKWKNNRIIV